MVKEKFFLSEALVATLFGICFGPIATNALNPFAWNIYQITFQFSQVLIVIQVMAASISLSKKFWKTRYKSVLMMMFPVMIYQWLSTAVIVYLVLQRNWLESLLLAACMTPTDPILANSIVSGRFADMHVAMPIRQLLSAESAINDGMTLAFFRLAYLLLTFPIGPAFGVWAWSVWLYELGLAAVLGALMGFLAQFLLKYSESNGFMDKKSFLSFEISLAVWILFI